MTPTGQTADGTCEVGVRRTFPGLDLEAAWRTGLALVESDPATGPARSRTEGVVARFPYQPPGWEGPSTLQLRVLEAASGATIAIHHERMPDEGAREAMRAHWSAALDRVR